jgi:hypothetical protein
MYFVLLEITLYRSLDVEIALHEIKEEHAANRGFDSLACC